MIRLRLAVLSLASAAACAKPAATPAPAPEPVASAVVDACAETRARLAAEPALMVDRPPAPTVMKPAPFQRPPRTALNRDGSAQVRAEVVIDTLGRADMRTFKLLAASHSWFADDLRRVLPQWRFSVAEMGGCKVPRLFTYSGGLRPRATAPARKP